MKKINFLILAILFVFSSCYIYKPYQFKEVETLSANEKKGAISLRPEIEKEKANESSVRKQRAEEEKKLEQKSQMELKSPDLTEKERQKIQETETGQNSFSTVTGDTGNNSNVSVPKNIPQTSISTEDSLKIKIKPNLYYRILADGKKYKIQAEQWEGDTLVSHILRKPEKVLRFHKNQIDEENLEERRFSKPFSDLITVGSYVAGGVAVLLLVL